MRGDNSYKPLIHEKKNTYLVTAILGRGVNENIEYIIGDKAN